MYPKNAASPEPIAIGAVVQISDGAVQTSGCTVRIKPIGVAEGDGAGTTAYSTDGIVLYTPTQAETNYTSFILIAKKTSCIPVSITVVTTGSATAGHAAVDWGVVANKTTTNALTGTTIAVTQKVDVDTIKTNPVVNAGTITFPTTATLASTTNITAAAGIAVSSIGTDVITATSIAADAITAAKIADGAIDAATFAAGAINAAAIASDAITDAKVASDVTIASVTGAVGSVTGNVGGSVASVATGGITAASIADGAIDRATFAADTGLQTTRSNTAQAGGSTSITLDASASATTDFYINQLVYLTGGTGAGQARFITAYNGTSKAATVNSAWATNPDNTSTFAIIPFDAIPGATAPTAAAVADAVWDEARSGHVIAGSFGEYVLADVTLISGDATAANNAESFFDGTGYAGTNNVIPTVTTTTTATNLTNLPTIPANWLTAAGTAADFTTEIQSGLATAAAVAALNNLSAAQVNSEVDTALADVGLTTTITGRIDAAVSSRMATYTQPTGFLAATFPTTVASTTNITAGTITTVGSVTTTSTEVTAIKAKTDSLTFTVAGKVDSNVLAIAGSTTAATNQSKAALAVYPGTCTSTGTTTTLIDTGLTQVDDHWIGRVVIFLTGTLAYQATTISDFTASSDTLTVVALTSAPQSGDTYLIV